MAGVRGTVCVSQPSKYTTGVKILCELNGKTEPAEWYFNVTCLEPGFLYWTGRAGPPAGSGPAGP